MILVVGGMASGKRTYVAGLGYEKRQFADAILDDSPVIFNVQDLLREHELDEELLAGLCAKDIVICTEVGLGVVPVEAEQAAWRERVGRACSELACHATSVVRMVCGIPVVLKGA